MTENEKIELFDKWYDENYDEWAEGEEGIALREELEQAFKGGIAGLEKENAELKKSCDETQELLDKQIEATYKLDKENAELKKENAEAKNLIEELASSLSVVGECDEEECELINKAQKFINKPIF